VTDLTIRAYTESDAAPVARLLNAIEAATDGGHRFSEAEIRAIFAAAVQDPKLDSRLVFTAAGTLVAGAMVSPPSPGGTRVRLEGGVHPRWRGRGIGRDLLSWQFSRAAEMRAERGLASAWTAETSATAADDSATRLYKRFGLRRIRYFLDMTAPTAGQRPAALPGGVHVACYTAELRAAVHEAHTEAFADHWGSEPHGVDEWARYTVGTEMFLGDLSRVAFDGDEVASYVLAYDGQDNQLYIGQVGTRRRWRGRGLATALMARSMAAAAAEGKRTAALGVDADSPTGAVGVYERLGFTTQHAPFAIYERELER
jgi:mycothiol synthase